MKLEEDSLIGLVGMAAFILLCGVLTKTVSLKHDQAMKTNTNWKGLRGVLEDHRRVWVGWW